MPPKSCRGRDTTNLQEYINDPLKEKKSLFVKALHNSKILQKFDGQVGVNECIFSYPESEWYAVYLLDSNGQQIWDPATGAKMLFFKLKLSPSGKEAIITTETTNITDTDLDGKQACAVNSNGNCALPVKSVSPSPAKPKKTTEKQAESQDKVDAEVAERLQTLAISPDGKKSSEKVDRTYFENLDSKMLIAQWMIDNMDEKDVVECVKQGSLSPDDLQRVEALSKTAPIPSGVAEKAAEIAASMPEKEVRKMFQRISKQSLSEEINKIKNPRERQQAIVNMCQRVQLDYKLQSTRTSMQIYDLHGEPISDDKALSECASIEAIRANNMLRQNVSRRMGPIREYVKGNIPEIWPDFSKKDKKSAMTSDELMIIVDNASGRKEGIIHACEIVGMPITKSEFKGRLGIITQYTDSEGNVLASDDDFEDVLKDCIKKVKSMGFGRRKASKKQLAVRKRFKAAAKKCKGKRNFQKCVGQMLRKKKTVTRKSPRASATGFAVGTVKTGLDGNKWVIKKASNGVKRWSKK